jgi:hypothetical protein
MAHVTNPTPRFSAEETASPPAHQSPTRVITPSGSRHIAQDGPKVSLKLVDRRRVTAEHVLDNPGAYPYPILPEHRCARRPRCGRLHVTTDGSAASGGVLDAEALCGSLDGDCADWRSFLLVGQVDRHTGTGALLGAGLIGIEHPEPEQLPQLISG